MRKTYQFSIYPNKNQEVKLNSTLAKSIKDAGWYQLMNFTKSKAECAGKRSGI